MLGGRVIFAEDATGSIGRIPPLEPEFWEVDAETLAHDRERNKWLRGRVQAGVRGGR